MANILKQEKQEQIIRCLVEGSSVRSTERLTGVHRDTIIRLMVRVGNGCQHLLDEKMRNLKPSNIQIDEIWRYIGKKERHVSEEEEIKGEVGDMWVFAAIDADTKLIPTFLVGKRTKENTESFLQDLASRLDSRVQLSSDQMISYVNAVWKAFGENVDYGQIVKSYEAEPIGPGRYSPPEVTSVEKYRIWGNPDENLISTSFVERQNLTMRMNIRRLTRLTNAFSKKLENHRAAIALYFAHYNFVREHRTLRTTPAVMAGIESWRWGIDQLLDYALAKS
ncbi:MAG TPA: IS1 family transposase [Anaerolineales bacterium]|nr:IS1 family transposase [Anaerolineales bacterium]